MTKKKEKSFLNGFGLMRRRFCPDLTSISKSEVSDLLAAAGTDAGALRRRLNESAKKLALAQLQEGDHGSSISPGRKGHDRCSR